MCRAIIVTLYMRVYIYILLVAWSALEVCSINMILSILT